MFILNNNKAVLPDNNSHRGQALRFKNLRTIRDVLSRTQLLSLRHATEVQPPEVGSESVCNYPFADKTIGCISVEVPLHISAISYSRSRYFRRFSDSVFTRTSSCGKVKFTIMFYFSVSTINILECDRSNIKMLGKFARTVQFVVEIRTKFTYTWTNNKIIVDISCFKSWASELTMCNVETISYLLQINLSVK